MPRERSRSPIKRRRTPIRGFGSDTRPRDIKRRRRSPAAVRSDQRSKPNVKHEVLSRAPNKGVGSNRFPGAAPRNTRPPVRRSSQPAKKTDVRRPSSSNPKDARKGQSSSSRRKESSGTSASRTDQKPKDTFFRDDNRAGNRGFKAPGIPAQDHFPRTVTPPILRPPPEKDGYSDYRSAAYKQDIDERRQMEEAANFASRGQRGLSLDRYRMSSPTRDPHLFPDGGMLRQGSPFPENRDMERDNYSSRPGKIPGGDGYRHEGGRSFKFDDAAKITVDIRRKVREPSPGMHNMIDTGDIVIVRRSGEGCRPIFEREEIGVGLKHMDESADYTERRVVAMLKQDRRSRSHSPDRMGFPHSSLHENFEVQRDKFESSIIASDPNANMIKPTLSDRWQQFEERPHKLEGGDRLDGHQIDNRGGDFQMMHVTTHDRYRRESFERNPGNFPQDQRPFIDLASQQSPPRDRFQRYSDKEPGPSGRQDRFERIQRNPNDLRHNLSRKRHGSLDTDLRPFDARLRILERKDGQKDTERRTADTTSDSRRRGGDRRPSSSSRSRKVKDDRLPDFSSRPEKYKYQEWQDKPEMIPKGAGYFEVTKHKDDRPSRIHSSYTKEMVGHRGSGNMTCLTDLRMINRNR